MRSLYTIEKANIENKAALRVAITRLTQAALITVAVLVLAQAWPQAMASNGTETAKVIKAL